MVYRPADRNDHIIRTGFVSCGNSNVWSDDVPGIDCIFFSPAFALPITRNVGLEFLFQRILK